MARISVKCKKQTGSADTYINYEAEVEILSAGSEVTIEADRSVLRDLYPEDVDSHFGAIREGAESVLRPRQLGATIRVLRVVFHPVDFNPKKCAELTASELVRVING